MVKLSVLAVACGIQEKTPCGCFPMLCLGIAAGDVPLDTSHGAVPDVPEAIHEQVDRDSVCSKDCEENLA